VKKKILIINTGGTFSKIYNPISGKLEIPKNNKTIKKIIKHSQISNIKIKGLIYKDSLEFVKKDRKKLSNFIKNTQYKQIIIIHGTDTIDKTASFLDKNIKDKTIVLTGSMIPFSINPIQSVANFMQGFGFLKTYNKNGIYIAMHSHIQNYKFIKKNKKLGIFECQTR
jgi:L-asparaginase